MRGVLAHRTRYIVLVAENVHNSHNASALVRTCDALGIQELHVVEEECPFAPTRGITLGSEQWVTICRWKSTEEALHYLSRHNYRVVATTPAGDVTLREVPLDKPVALWVGNEVAGLSEQVLRVADMRVRIPLVGFVESLNLSVTAGICLYVLRERLEGSGVDWRLTRDEQEELLVEWLMKSVPHSSQILAEWRRRAS